ncbi:MAG: hypothetical protein JW395_1587 [Nitrospira sp.]|nr:hypothetical protein [Nitrospira sp.]
MPIQQYRFKPGINRDGTDYSNNGGWFDCNKVRFRFTAPEKIGGWVKDTASSFLGVCRTLFAWTTLNLTNFIGLGTTWKYYVLSGGTFTDITPIRRTVTLGANPIATTNAPTTITITDALNGSVVDDFVTFSGATTVGGLSTSVLNAEHQIASLVDGNSYRITVGAAATSTATGGGSAISAVYQLSGGLDADVAGNGWGAGVWGRDTWGSGTTVTAGSSQLRLWSQDNFGEDLLINPRNGGIYYFDAGTPTTRAVNITSLSGANEAPTVAMEVLTSDVDRHVIAFGCNPEGSSTQDKLLIRFSDTESAAIWNATSTTTAGDLRLSHGSEFVTAAQTKQEILVWTDKSVHSMTFVGPPFTFGVNIIAKNTNIISSNAKIVVDDVAYWMGIRGFYQYNGRVGQIPCPVTDYVYNDINLDAVQKIYAGSNVSNMEVWWFYPSSTSEENDRYVVHNYADKIWYYGTLARSAWLDEGPGTYPRATDTSGYIYLHENGFDDGSTDPASAITAYIESSPFEIGPGEKFSLINKIIPDITFRNSSAASPSVDMSLTPKNQPGSNIGTADTESVTRTSTVTVEQFTELLDVRVRGRGAILKVQSDDTGVAWRLGTLRMEVRQDGRR